jgi:hypothetical protein
VADHRMVLAIFADEAAADAAAKSLMAWEKDNEFVSRPVGVLVADEHGRIKEHKLGARAGKRGAGIGLVLAAIAPPSLLVGLVGGAVIGRLYHKGLGLTDEDRERIAAELAGGKAAIGVLVEEDPEAWMISDRLKALGGIAEVHEVTEDALDAVAAAAPAEPQAAAEPSEPPTTTA